MARFIQNPQGPGSGLRTLAPNGVNSAEEIQRQINPEPTLPVSPESGANPLQNIANVPPIVAATMEIPKPKFAGMAGVHVQPDVTDNSSLVGATGNPYLLNRPYEPVLDEQGNVARDESGNPLSREVPLDDYQKEQQRQLSGLRDFSNANLDEFGDSAADTARSLFEKSNEAGFTNLSPEKIEQKSITAATPLEYATQSIRNELFSNNSESVKVPKINPDTGELYNTGIAAGTEILQDAGLEGESLSNALKIVPSYIALSFARAVTQMSSPSTGINPDGSNVENNDEANEINIINATAAAFDTALANRGLNLPDGTSYKLAQAAFAGKYGNGHLLEYQNKDGMPMFAPSKALKDQSKALEDLAAAVTGSERRHMASRVPLGEFINQGNQITKNSKMAPGTKHNGAFYAKNILGRIAEMFNPKSVNSLMKQLEDVTAKFDDESGFSKSIFADRHKMGETAFNSLKNAVGKDEDYNANDSNKQLQYEAKQDEHAREEMQNRLARLKYDLGLAQKDLGHLLYTSYAHATANHRFDRRNPDTDIISSKSAIREMLNFGVKSIIQVSDLFDTKEIDNLKALANRVFNKTKPGVEQHQALMALTPYQRSALGLMEMAVNNYYNYTAPEGIKTKVAGKAPADNIMAYTPEIGAYLANIGKMYNEWLEDPTKASPEIVNLLAGMERGEASANQNLWDDMFQAQKSFIDPAKKRMPIQVTAMNFDDGNQNGIFIQSLFAGNPNTALRLSTYDPSLGNMRDYTYATMLDQMDDILSDRPEVMTAWKNFFEAVRKESNSVVSDLIKKPLMENSYSKDAGMFFENMYEFLNNGKYNRLAMKHLEKTGVYKNDVKNGTVLIQAARDLNLGLEGALRKVVDSTYTKNLARYGRMFAMLDTVPTHKGVGGDDMQYSTVEMGFTRDEAKDRIQPSSSGQSQEMMPGYKETIYSVGGNNLAVREGRRGLTPSATAGVQSYYNAVENKHESYNNPYGSRLARQIGVLSVQSTDADLLKLMLNYVNKDLKIPMPIMTVHDALITSPESLHIYRNAYNNIAIPQAIPEIKQFGKRIDEAYENAKNNVFNNILAGRQFIDIGSTGRYKVLGGYFNDLQDKLNSDSYKKIFDKRTSKSKANQGWEKYVANTKQVLKEAKLLGWEPNSKYLAVNRNAFKALFTLAENNEKMGGAENIRKTFVSGFSAGVDRAYKAMIDNKFIKKHGIAQMTTTGAGGSAIRNFVEWVKPEPKVESESTKEKNMLDRAIEENKSSEDSGNKGWNWERNYVLGFENSPDVLSKIINDGFERKFSEKAKVLAEVLLKAK